MNAIKLCKPGTFPTYMEFRQLDTLCRQYSADDDFRKKVDSFLVKQHPAVVTIFK